jgi:hypothetical protein
LWRLSVEGVRRERVCVDCFVDVVTECNLATKTMMTISKSSSPVDPKTLQRDLRDHLRAFGVDPDSEEGALWIRGGMDAITNKERKEDEYVKPWSV